MPKNRKPSRGLVCYKCGSAAVRVTEAQQMKRADGRARLHADVRCRRCGHEWWSRHSDALRRSRAEDAAAHRPDKADVSAPESAETPLGAVPV